MKTKAQITESVIEDLNLGPKFAINKFILKAIDLTIDKMEERKNGTF